MNEKINATADVLSDIVREKLEATEYEVKSIVYKFVNKSSTKINYKRFQQTLSPNIKKELIKTLRKERIDLFKMVDNSQKIAKWNSKELKYEITQTLDKVLVSAVTEHKEAVKSVLRLEKLDDLTNAIFKQTQEGIKGDVKINVARGGKTQQWGYKEYMENKIRNTLQVEIGEQQIKYNADAKVVFYISNVYSDCADDHKPYQGKYYYDERYKSYGLSQDILSKINNRISQLKMLSIQEVRDAPAYLTTRPNCRHKLSPVAISRVLDNSANQTVDHFNLSTGKYSKNKYDVSQQQRYKERQIRYHERQVEYNKKLYKQTGDDKYLTRQNQSEFTKSKWQKDIKEFTKDNKLKRDTRRETASIVWKDVGAKYQLVGR